MNVTCAKKEKQPQVKFQGNVLQAEQQVNRIGKYLHKHIDSAFKIKFTPSMCDVYMFVLYQIPRLQRIPGKGPEYNGMKEMTLNLNITTYQNKLRVNMLEVSPNEKTLGHKVYSPEKLMNLEQSQDMILQDMIHFLHKEYDEYDFLF